MITTVLYGKSPKDPILDYRMTCVTFGVSASSFISNMAIKQNAYDHANEYLLAAKVVHESFYMDDSLTGADIIEDAQKLQQQLQDLLPVVVSYYISGIVVNLL